MARTDVVAHQLIVCDGCGRSVQLTEDAQDNKATLANTQFFSLKGNDLSDGAIWVSHDLCRSCFDHVSRAIASALRGRQEVARA